MTDDLDPYAPPESELDGDRRTRVRRPRLAERGTRLVAHILDGIFYVLAAAPGMLVGALVIEDENVALVLGGIGMLAFFVYQLWLLRQNAWTLGKRVLGIRIVRTDYSEAGLVRIFFLRMLLTQVIGALPLVGPVFSLADPLFIFGNERRCLHDHLADTIVILA